ncbi:hypothetical protein [Enterococcus sp. UD-01]|uniref:hypothetical protein n=1 Tax=Enterococcus sp. UD-01 TaxID=3373911 RepID=UPI003832BCD4
MKKKTWFIGLILLILIGGVGFMWFKQNEAERKEQEMVRMETITAKQIKNTFANVTKIEFSEDYVENTLAGFTSVDVTISTDDGVVGTIGTDFSPNNRAKTLESYIGGTEFEQGITEKKVKIIYSNASEGEL